MKRKIFAFLIAFTFVAGTVGYTSADTTNNKSAELAVLLPASDMVMTLDSDRFLNQALPQILSSNKPMLAKINAEIEKIKGKTGLDLREFRQVAVGVKTVQVSKTETDFEPVILARGTVTAKTLVSVAKIASKGKYKKKKVDGRTIYIFSPKEIIEENKDNIKGGNSMFDNMIAKVAKSFSNEVAMSAYDSNTIAIGSLERVKETVSNKDRISNDVLGLLNRKPGAIMNMGAKTPFGLGQFLPLDNDELGKDLDAIRQVQGSMDLVQEDTMLSFLAKSQDADKAESLENNLKALQLVFSRILKGMKGEDKKIYGRTLANMEISREADELSLDLKVPQSDLDVIIGKK